MNKCEGSGKKGACVVVGGVGGSTVEDGRERMEMWLKRRAWNSVKAAET